MADAGPIPPLDPAILALTPEPPSLVDDYQLLTAGLLPLYDEYAAAEGEIIRELAEDPMAGVAEAVAVAAAELGSIPEQVGLGELDDAFLADDEIAPLIIEAGVHIPAEAYEPPAIDITPPLPLDPGFVPEELATGLEPAPTPEPTPTPTPEPVPAPAPAVVTVEIFSLIRGLTNTFNAGEQWRFEVRGPAGQAVYVQALQDGVNLGTWNMGLTDATGYFEHFGAMGPEHVGSWFETWWVGSIENSATIAFTVFP